MKIEVYYDKPSDTVILIKDGTPISHVESVHSSGYLDNFNITDVNQFNNLTGPEILENHKYVMDDFECFFTEDEVAEYYEKVRTSKIEGELITTKFV